MKAHVKTGWQLSEEDRDNLRSLLVGVGLDAGQDDPAFVRLLGAWEWVKGPWNLTPVVPAYHARDGWLTAGVGPVVDAIRVHLEAAIGGHTDNG